MCKYLVVLLLLVAVLVTSAPTSGPIERLAPLVHSYNDSDFISGATCTQVKNKPCFHVPRCEKQQVTIKDFYVSNTRENQYIRPQQESEIRMCHNTTGIYVQGAFRDVAPHSPHKQCNSPVWQNSAVVELFIYPVKNVNDSPRFYYEIDVTPTNTVFAALIQNPKGTSTMCTGCVPFELPCSGSNHFPQYPKLKSEVHHAASKWTTIQHIPFDMFHDNHRATNIYSFNFYRYSYPHGMQGAFELQAVSPTFSPSFHEPHRFGVLILD